MDDSRTNELRQAVLAALKERTKLMCRLQGAWGVSFNGQSFIVGHDKVCIELRPVSPNGFGEANHHTLLVKTTNTKPKVFRETRAGWFPLPHIAKHILECVEHEAKLRQDATKQRQLTRGAETVIQHLTRLGLPPNITLAPSQTPGAIDLTATGLTETQVRQSFNTLHPVQGDHDSFWDHINQPDE